MQITALLVLIVIMLNTRSIANSARSIARSYELWEQSLEKNEKSE